MTRRKVHRSDANQKAVIEILRRAGAEVHVIGRPVDLLVWWGKWVPVEIKNPEGRNRLTPYQEQFLETTRGPVAIVDSPEGAIRTIQRLIR